MQHGIEPHSGTLGTPDAALRPPQCGRVVSVLCSDVQTALAEMALGRDAPDSGRRLACVTLTSIPPVGKLLQQTLDRLAELALSIWPHWYALEAEDPKLPEVEGFAPPAVSRHWLQSAWALCASGRPPLLAAAARAHQVGQLALALAPEDLTLTLAVLRDIRATARLLGLARAAEWLAKESGAGVMVLLPQGLAAQPALDSILYGARRYQAAIPAELTDDPNPSREARHRLLPVIGVPHPFSPGEQALAALLRQDPELAPLFGFNRPVDTIKGTRYLVDLVWYEGRLAVEVDSFGFHGGPGPFARDRRRDYELLSSGWVVLRLTHDEAAEDTPAALAKVRELVRLRTVERSARMAGPQPRKETGPRRSP